MQLYTYLGRYLAFTAITSETNTWRESNFKLEFNKIREEGRKKQMDQVASKFYNLHLNVAEIIKKLMKNANCKEQVLKWLRLTMSLNLGKRKMYVDPFTATLQASDGFILNYIDLMLILCKPFIKDFHKFPTFINKINCFYLMSDKYINKGLDLEKLVFNKDGLQLMLNGQRTAEDCSGFTAECVVNDSNSLLGGGSSQK